MPAVYVTGTAPVSATPASDFLAIIDAAILSHPNWSKVESNLATTTTAGVANVYKCSGAGNSFGADWFLVVWRKTASQTDVLFEAFETWDSVSTHTGTRPANNSSTNFTTPATGPYGTNGGYVVNNNSFAIDSAATGHPDQWDWSGISTSSPNQYMIYVSKSRFVISTGGMVVIVGLYQQNPRQVAAVANMFPLFGQIKGNLSIYAVAAPGGGDMPLSFSRMPVLSGCTTGALATSSYNAVGSVDTAGSRVDPIEGVLRSAGVLVYGRAPSGIGGGNVSTQWGGGWIRGSLPGFYFLYCSGSGVGILDLVQLSDGTQLTPVGQSAGNSQTFVAITSDA